MPKRLHEMQMLGKCMKAHGAFSILQHQFSCLRKPGVHQMVHLEHMRGYTKSTALLQRVGYVARYATGHIMGYISHARLPSTITKNNIPGPYLSDNVSGYAELVAIIRPTRVASGNVKPYCAAQIPPSHAMGLESMDAGLSVICQ